ncbi:MAG: hypothetical protein CM15mP16_12530 [Candidatus Pelagibacterales bacterium]|nr:MAG: hypothetical protein CM15mP16_12530 [Pelagibacterales bacterium]
MALKELINNVSSGVAIRTEDNSELISGDSLTPDGGCEKDQLCWFRWSLDNGNGGLKFYETP